MSNTLKKIHELEAVTLNQYIVDKSQKNNNDIEKDLKNIFRKARRFNSLSSIFFVVCIIIFVISLFGVFSTINNQHQIYHAISLLLFPVSILAAIGIIPFIHFYQNYGTNEHEFTPADPLENYLSEVFDDLLSGQLESFYRALPGAVSIDTKISKNNICLDKRISPEFYRNRYSPLLASQRKKLWSYVSVPRFGTRFERPVYVLRQPELIQPEIIRNADNDASETSLQLPTKDLAAELLHASGDPSYNDGHLLISQEEANHNTNPDYDWLCQGDEPSFERCLDEFLRGEIALHRWRIYKTALTAARRELKRGGARGTLEKIKEHIEDEVRDKLQIKTPKIPGFGRTTLTNLLLGKKGTKDIRTYFSELTQKKSASS
ncbi:hypothetical protein [Acetobacter thailandicus]|uniref:hypothetical protein n=1 Tax=Acetobacter thailandicus TaxID=1502842 RepID=UPI001BA937C3|nr:hypothetical protein [Acetobacter thailandicus]MBS0980752.1 hypothetical protein [Acetobacter thailandicus]